MARTRPTSLDASCPAPPAPDAEQEAFLHILRVADQLQTELADLLKPADLSPTQYNVLRILRGAGETGLPCGAIAGRMLTRDPDVTRLLDRLEKRGLIDRGRDPADRRVVLACITAAGRRALAGLDEPVRALHRRQLGHLGDTRLRSLSSLLARASDRT